MNRVLLPRTLFVTKKGHTEDSSKNMHERLKEDSQYILCAAQNHRGKSAYGGNYVAEAMDWTTGVWYEYNNKEVTLLPNGSNSSYYPLASDTKFSQDTSTSGDDREIDIISHNSVEISGKSDLNKFLLRGSADAYNLFYVKKSFLARCAKRQLLDFHDQLKTLKSFMSKKDLLQIKNDVISKVTK